MIAMLLLAGLQAAPLALPAAASDHLLECRDKALAYRRPDGSVFARRAGRWVPANAADCATVVREYRQPNAEIKGRRYSIAIGPSWDREVTASSFTIGSGRYFFYVSEMISPKVGRTCLVEHCEMVDDKVVRAGPAVEAYTFSNEIYLLIRTYPLNSSKVRLVLVPMSYISAVKSRQDVCFHNLNIVVTLVPVSSDAKWKKCLGR